MILNTAQLLAGRDIVIDTFDTSIGCQLVQDFCAGINHSHLHLGLASDHAESCRIPREGSLSFSLASNIPTLT